MASLESAGRSESFGKSPRVVRRHLSNESIPDGPSESIIMAYCISVFAEDETMAVLERLKLTQYYSVWIQNAKLQVTLKIENKTEAMNWLAEMTASNVDCELE